jgi:hypothetical protein
MKNLNLEVTILTQYVKHEEARTKALMRLKRFKI